MIKRYDLSILYYIDDVPADNEGEAIVKAKKLVESGEMRTESIRISEHIELPASSSK